VPLGVAPTRQQLRSWRGHPLIATAIRIVAFTTPIVAALAWSAAVSRLIASPHAMPGRAVWLIGMLGTSTAVLFLTERLARRLLPLAALLKLSLMFPDHVPSRFSIALRTGTTRQLARRLQQAKLEPATRAGATELLTLVAALNHHDPLTRGHSERVRALSDLLAAQLQLDPEDREKVRWAALLHDIGKLRVPGEILRKAGKPTADEWTLLKTHPAEGLDLIRGPIADWLGEWTSAIGEHHEQFNGSGYPNGLSGTDISYAGRLVAVADVFDVITAARSYKKPMTIHEARLELTRCAGTQFDPDMVRAFLQISIGDLRKAMGPLSLLTQLAVFGRLAAAPAASTVAGTLIAATGLVGPVTSVYSEPDRSYPPVAHEEVAERSSTAATTPSGEVPKVPDTPGDGAPSTGTTLPIDTPTQSAGEPGAPVATPVDATGPVAGAPAPNGSTPTSSPAGGTPSTNALPGAPNTTAGPVASAPAVSVPTISVPTISVPTISVPTISVPTISVPTISVPTISVPPISVPPVTVPITLPGISVPPITVPVITVPVITLPVITVPPVTLPTITLPPVTLPPVTLPKIRL
jgi:putative nucleotidyltransferase with HDIG domain